MAHKQKLEALKKLDSLSEKLQKEGKLLDALQQMEKSLILRGHLFGLDSVEVFRACKSVGEMCNYLAMTYLQQDEFDITLELLNKAVVLTERHRAIRAVTFNNLGCFYRKKGKLRTAMSYLEKALALESKLRDNSKSADTHLNMCTILSELGRHDKALTHARTALRLLLLELFGPSSSKLPPIQQQQQSSGQSSEAQSSGRSTGHTAALAHAESKATGSAESKSQSADAGAGAGADEKKEEKKAKLPQDRLAVLAIAYHNLAVQQEFLKEYTDGLSSYEKAVKVVSTHLGESHPLHKSLSESHNHAKEKLPDMISKQKEAQMKRRSKSSDSRQKPSRAASSSKHDPADDTDELNISAVTESGDKPTNASLFVSPTK